MNVRRTLYMFLALVLMATLVLACSSGGNNGNNNTANPGNTTNPGDTPDPSTGPDNNAGGSDDNGGTDSDGLIPDVQGELSILVVLSQLNAMDPELGGVYDYFKTYYPDLKFNQQEITHEEYAPEKLTQAITAGNTPDVFVTVPGDIPDLIQKQYIAPLDDLLAANPDYVATLEPSSLETNKFGGKTYGITWMALPKGWLLNTDLFEKMGVPIPTDDWTIDEFIEINKMLVDKQNGISGSNPNLVSPNEVFGWLESYGVSGIKMADGKPVSNFAEDPNAVRALEKWIEYAVRSNIAFTDEEKTKFNLSDPWNAYWMNGHTGMVPFSLFGQPYNSDTQSNQFNWTVLRQPQGPDGHRATAAGGITLGIFPTSEKKELAMKYIQIITSKHFYENARMKTGTGDLWPLTISPGEPQLPLGLPAIAQEFTSAPENQAAVDGFVRALQDSKPIDYAGFGALPLQELIGRLKEVEAGTIQIADMLKQVDEAINTKYYSTIE